MIFFKHYSTVVGAVNRQKLALYFSIYHADECFILAGSFCPFNHPYETQFIVRWGVALIMPNQINAWLIKKGPTCRYVWQKQSSDACYVDLHFSILACPHGCNFSSIGIEFCMMDHMTMQKIKEQLWGPLGPTFHQLAPLIALSFY